MTSRDKAIDRFKKGVEEFLCKTGMADSKLGIEALNNPMFVNRLRNGRIPNIVTAEKVINYIENYEPEEEFRKPGDFKKQPLKRNVKI